MKKILVALGITIAISGCDVISQIPTIGGNGVTEAEAGGGIKEALSQGLVNAVLKLNKEDGFFKDAIYKFNSSSNVVWQFWL